MSEELSPDDTVILDNAPFHPKDAIVATPKNNGYNTLFLPRYSPKDNKIEHAWFPIKNSTRKIMQTIADIKTALAITIINHAN